jgi:hypothetical protein
MTRLITYVAVVAAGVVGLLVLMGATKNQPDELPAGASSTLELAVSTRGYPGGEQTAAHALVAVCAATVGDNAVSPPEAVGDRWRITVTPALGEHGRKRFEGCLEDVTLDRVIAHVAGIRTSG